MVGWSVSFVFFFFFFFPTLESSQILETGCTWILLSVLLTASASLVGMNALTTEHSRFLGQAAYCDWVLFSCPSCLLCCLWKVEESFGTTGTTDCSAWAAVSLFTHSSYHLHVAKEGVLAQEEESAFPGSLFLVKLLMAPSCHLCQVCLMLSRMDPGEEWAAFCC